VSDEIMPETPDIVRKLSLKRKNVVLMAASVDTKVSVFQSMLDSTRSETHKETQHIKRISETYRWPLAT
jgi:hypothetical protein